MSSPTCRAPAPPPAPGHDEYTDFALLEDVSDNTSEESSEEEVDSDGSPFRADSPDPPIGEDDDITWMPPRDMERASKIAYALINIDGPTDNPSPFIHATLFSVAPTVHCSLHPSSRGCMMLWFNNRGDRDAMVDLCPIIYDGACLSLERSEETLNRFDIEQKWLVAVSAIDFPEEHWDLEGIPPTFHKLGTVIDIDSAYLGDNHSVLRVVTARRTTTGIHNDIYLGNPSHGACGKSLGSAFTIEVLWIWPCEEQLDALGNLRPFFPYPSGANGGGNAPNGLFGPPPPPGPILHGAAIGPPSGTFGGFSPFPGFRTYYYGFVNSFPLPPLSSFPLIIHLTPSPKADRTPPVFNSCPLLALP